MLLSPPVQNTNSMKRSIHITHSRSSKSRRISSKNNFSERCDSCRHIDFRKVLDLSWKDLQLAGQNGCLIAEFGTRLSDNIVASCDVCRLFRGMIDHSAAMSEALELRAYSAFRNMREPSFKGLPEWLKTKDIPHLAIVSLNSSARPSSFMGTKRAFCASNSDQCNQIFTPKIPSQDIDYVAITTWLECCKKLHRSLCSKQKSTVRPSRFIDCNSSPPSLVRAPASAPYLALSYTWGDKSQGFVETTRSIMSPIIPCPPKTISDAIIVTQKLGFRYLWVDGYCIDQDDEKDKISQVKIMDEIYGGAELTIIAAAGSHNNFGLPGVSTTPRTEWRPVVDLGNIKIMCMEESPQRLIRSTTWAQRAWTYQEALLSQRLLYFTEREVYFECHSMQIREATQGDWESLHCKQGKLYAQLNSGLFLGKVSCPGSYIRSPLKFLMRFYELVRQYTTRKMSREEDSLTAFAGVMRYLEGGKVPIHQLIGVPFLYSSNSVEQTHDSFLVSLLWTHHKTFPPRKDFPLPHPTRRPKLPSWSWAGWEGEVNFVIKSSSEERYSRFQPQAKIMHVKGEDGVHFDSSTIFSNPGAVEQGIPYALTIRARLLLPGSYSISFTPNKPMCRITSKLNPPGMHPNWDPSRPGPPSRRGKPQPPRYLAGATGKLYLYKGPAVKTKLSEYFETNHFQTVLIATSPKLPSHKQRNENVYFLILEPKGNDFSRVGVLVVKEALESFSRDLLFEERSFSIV